MPEANRESREFYGKKMALQRKVFSQLVDLNILTTESLVDFIGDHGSDLQEIVVYYHENHPEIAEDELVGEIYDCCKDILYFDQVIGVDLKNVFHQIVFEKSEDGYVDGLLDRSHRLVKTIEENENQIKSKIEEINSVSGGEDLEQKLIEFLLELLNKAESIHE